MSFLSVSNWRSSSVKLGESLLVLGMSRAVLGLDHGELFLRFIEAVGELLELLALRGRLGGFERTARTDS